MRNYLVLILALLMTGLVLGCGNDDDDAEADGGDTDTDADTDTDTDTDTDSDTDVCTGVEGIEDWGGPCHTNADCPSNTECIILGSISTDEGYCSPICCNFESADVAYCTDVATGQENCNVGMTPDEGITWEPPFHCIIYCNTEADCPSGTACVDTGTGGLICSGYAEVVVDAGPDA